MRKILKLALTTMSLFVVLAVLKLPSASAAQSSALTQSYSASSSVLPGMLVESNAKSAGSVQPLLAQDIKSMLGVVIPEDDAPIVLVPQSSSSQQVLVANSGHYELLVSNQDGSIKAGDYVSMSALPGIASKATSSENEIIGRAVGSFNGSSNVLGRVNVTTTSGNKITVAIGVVQADINLSPNPLFQTNNKIPSFLSKLANGVANKEVAPVRVYLSLVILLSVIAITGFMFYGAAHGGLSAIGRNPLAKKAIGRGLLQTIILGLIILAAGIFGAYLILI